MKVMEQGRMTREEIEQKTILFISGQPEQIGELKKMAAQEEKTVSAFILEKTGVGDIK